MKEPLWWTVRRFIKNIPNWPYMIKRGIKNLIIWFPIIWNDRNYDPYYIYVILRKKLIEQEKFIRLHGYHANHLKDARDIKVAILLLDRIIKDEYHKNVFKHHDKKWGDIDIKFIPEGNMNKIEVIRKNIRTKEDEEQEKKESKYLYKKVDMMKKQDIEFLFDHLKKHIEAWWD